MQKARDTLSEFLAALQARRPTQTQFSVNVHLTDGTHTENMWLTDVTFRDGQFRGRLGNDPLQLTHVQAGQRITASEDQLVDWMYVDDGKLIGNYTLRVLRSRLSEAERAGFDLTIPFRVD